MLLASSPGIELLQNMNPDVLGAAMILGTILFFVTVVVSIVTICQTITRLAVVRSNKSLVQDLLSKGYSVDDVERLVYGQAGWNKLTRAIRKIGKSKNRAVPPVKATRVAT